MHVLWPSSPVTSPVAFSIWPLHKGLINCQACCQALDPYPITKRILFEQILPGVTLPEPHHLKGQTTNGMEDCSVRALHPGRHVDSHLTGQFGGRKCTSVPFDQTVIEKNLNRVR